MLEKSLAQNKPLGLAPASHRNLISPNHSNPACLLKPKTVVSALCIVLSSEMEDRLLAEKILEEQTLKVNSGYLWENKSQEKRRGCI